jgi:putative intracellular protease/amidase
MTPQAKPRIIIPLPSRDFDPSEVAVPWKMLRDAGFDILFATPDGARSHADPRMLSGEGLDLWGAVPLLRRIKLVGLVVRANGEARAAYRELENDAAFLHPLAFDALAANAFDGMVLPGGHWRRGMVAYLEDSRLHRFVGDFFDSDRPVGAVCHGVVLAARSKSAATGKSVLYGRKTVGLPWAMERKVWNLMKFAGRFWDPDYYRTYDELPGDPAGYRSVEAEVTRALASPSDFVDVPKDSTDYFRKTSGMFRDTAQDARPAWIVVDGNYVSGRWPGDVHALANALATLVRAQHGGTAKVT